MDNASVNDTAMVELKKLFVRDKISSLNDWDPKDNRIMCIPHTVHIAVSHIIRDCFGVQGRRKRRGPKDPEVADEFAPFEDDDSADSDDSERDGTLHQKIGVVADWNSQTYEQALVRNPLILIRKLVRGIRASGERRDAFRDSIRDGIKDRTFIDPENGMVVTSLPEVELLRDVPTRWDSTYQMITRAKILRPVCRLSRLIDFLTSFLITHNGIM